MLQDSPWKGKEALVLAFDCGVVQSGVSYVHLVPRTKPSIRRVLGWSEGSDAKVLTQIWYDADGVAKSFGSATVTPKIQKEAEAGQWSLVKHFKLHVHPVTATQGDQEISAPPLPHNVSVNQVYKDFFGYLYRHTRDYFLSKEPKGATTWQRFEKEGSIEFVLAHPNGWGPHEQAFLRRAIVGAGLLVPSQAEDRVSIITETEACVHYAMRKKDLGDKLKSGAIFLVCDIGGSAVNTTLYTVFSKLPSLRLEEKRASTAIQAGGIYIDFAAQSYFNELFFSAEFYKRDINVYKEDVPRFVARAVAAFEAGPKRTFKSSADSDMTIDFNGPKTVTVDALGISSGKASVSGPQVQGFFSLWAKQITESVRMQAKGHIVQNMFLFGGLADSPYIFNAIRTAFPGIEVVGANDQGGKAVADGAISWHLHKSLVTARATRFAYGLGIRCQYDPSNPIHEGRSDSGFVLNTWSEIIAKDTVVITGKERRSSYFRRYATPNPDNLSTFEVNLYALVADHAPYFVVDEQGKTSSSFSLACVIKADLSNMRGALARCESNDGPSYWKLDFEVGISFGATELAANVIWTDAKKIEHRSKATIISKEVA